MTVKTAPERAGLRNIKNKLVQLIHNVVPPHSCFPPGLDRPRRPLLRERGGMAAALPLGIKGAALTVGRSLPVCYRSRASSLLSDTSHSGQKAKNSLRADVFRCSPTTDIRRRSSGHP